MSAMSGVPSVSVQEAAALLEGASGARTGGSADADQDAGARERLAEAVGTEAETSGGIDLAALIAAIDDRLGRLARNPDDAAIDPPPLPRRKP